MSSLVSRYPCPQCGDTAPSPPRGGKGVDLGGRQAFLHEVRKETEGRKARLDKYSTTRISWAHFAKALDDRLYVLAVLGDLQKYDRELREEFTDRFPLDIPHVTNLPDDVFHRFRLKDPEKIIKCRSYACPKRYKDAWKQLSLGVTGHLPSGYIVSLL